MVSEAKEEPMRTFAESWARKREIRESIRFFGCGKNTRDLFQVKCIKAADGVFLVEDAEIKARWKEYFNKLFNVGGNTPSVNLVGSNEPVDPSEEAIRDIHESEVREALRGTKTGKVLEPDTIPIQVRKCLGD
ncbi:uncharacterized protein LOC113294571 [Papaver somniferum]|uniref:uncharacterized protein LOC113294571 n=1 Tax=Papaver somniferum TaxID=3469 RepID=UPI000E6FE719|nr:uncharacterized protein LOC113294571 [Papaver somniferum]